MYDRAIFVAHHVLVCLENIVISCLLVALHHTFGTPSTPSTDYVRFFGLEIIFSDSYVTRACPMHACVVVIFSSCSELGQLCGQGI